MFYMADESLAFLAGCLAGPFLMEDIRENIRPLIRVRRASGIPIRKMNRERARSLDSYLSRWSKFSFELYTPRDDSELKRQLPEQVRRAWEKHINQDDVEIYASSLDAESHLKSWQNLFGNIRVLKERVKTFYNEPAVKAYLQA
jgi:hypothetical protein